MEPGVYKECEHPAGPRDHVRRAPGCGGGHGEQVVRSMVVQGWSPVMTLWAGLSVLLPSPTSEAAGAEALGSHGQGPGHARSCSSEEAYFSSSDGPVPVDCLLTGQEARLLAGRAWSSNYLAWS